jgi:molybdate transport system substrate-binding protein
MSASTFFEGGIVHACVRIVLLAGVSLMTLSGNAAEIRIFSTPAASTALRAVVPGFERSSGHKVVLDFSNIAATRKRIAAGEAYDIAVVSPKAVEDLVSEGKFAAGATQDLGRTGLAMIARKGTPLPDISTPEAFRRTLLEAKVVSYSATGESGIGFLKVLDKMGIAAEMKPRIRASRNAGAAIDAGEALIGITGVGAGLSYTKLDYVGPLPAAVQEYVYVAAGVNAAAKEPEAARAFLKHLSDPAVVKLMRENGLEL